MPCYCQLTYAVIVSHCRFVLQSISIQWSLLLSHSTVVSQTIFVLAFNSNSFSSIVSDSPLRRPVSICSSPLKSLSTGADDGIVVLNCKQAFIAGICAKLTLNGQHPASKLRLPSQCCELW